MMTSWIGAIPPRARRGSGSIEAALVMALFVFTLMGIIDVGQVLVLHQGLVERARAGARWGVVNNFDATAITNVVLYNTPTPAPGSQPLLNLTASMVTATQHAANTPEWRIQVRIDNYPFRFFSPPIAGLYTARPIVVDMSGEGFGATS